VLAHGASACQREATVLTSNAAAAAVIPHDWGSTMKKSIVESGRPTRHGARQRLSAIMAVAAVSALLTGVAITAASTASASPRVAHQVSPRIVPTIFDSGSVYAGTAPAYKPSLEPWGLYGFTAVFRFGTGSYCLLPSFNTVIKSTLLIVSAGSGGGGGGNVVVSWTGTCNQARRTGYWVSTTVKGVLVNGQPFSAIVV
jgi:hypothetical protein